MNSPGPNDQPPSENPTSPDPDPTSSGSGLEPGTPDPNSPVETAAVDDDPDLRRLDRTLDRMDELLKAGQLKEGIKAERLARRQLAALDALPSRQHKRIQRRLTRAQPKLQEMRDWRHWSTTRAREDLIEQIEALTTSDTSPAAIARKVQRARKAWQEWDRSGDSGGKQLWDRFDSACTRAYAACQAHFQRQAQQRQANRERREALCAQLETCFATTDWRHPDWRALDKLTQRYRREWGRAGPVDRKFKKALDQRYQAAWTSIEDYLDRERARNFKHRQALIEQVRGLSNHDDLTAAVEQVKQAQTDWQPTVVGDRRTEQQLWDAFKSACDAVYARRDTQRREQVASRESNAESRIALCEEIESVVDVTGPDAVETASGRVARAKERWQQIGEVPRKHEAALEKRFRRACARLEDRAHQAARLLARQSLEQLRTRAGLCAEIEAAALDDASEARLVLADAVHRWEQLPVTDAATLTTVTARFEAACRALHDQDGARDSLRAQLAPNLARAQELCLQLEILAEVESPAQYAKARMALQIRRLSAAMSRAGHDDPLLDPTQLRRAYWEIGALDPAQRQQVDARFRAAEEALAQPAGLGGPPTRGESA